MSFRIVRLEVNEIGDIVARQEMQPFYELRAHAAAMAELAAARCDADYAYDAAAQCWGGRDRHDRKFRLVVESVAMPDDIAA